MIREDFDDADISFNDYFNNTEGNKDLEELYEVINSDDLKLENVRKENYNKYKSIYISKLRGLPSDFDDMIFKIMNIYSLISESDLLIEDLDEALDHEKALNNILRYFRRLDRMVRTTLKEYTAKNKEAEKEFSDTYFNSLNVDSSIKSLLINKRYNLKLCGMVEVSDNYEALKRELTKAQLIDEIKRIVIMNVGAETKQARQEKLARLNDKISNLISYYNNEIDGLDSIILPNSKYFSEFIDFKNFYKKLMEYDHDDYENAKQTYEVLSDNSRFKLMLTNFNDKLRKESFSEITVSEDKTKEFENSLKYVEEKYLDMLSDSEKSALTDIRYIFDGGIYDIEELESRLGIIVSSIWNKSITDVYSYEPGSDFRFICTNNQFIDEKYQAILLTSEELPKITDYLDYQIGFICSCNNNVMYVTTKKDIMEEDYRGQVNLKTPRFMEERFKNLSNCYRISLDGKKTSVVGVYFIDDGNFTKKSKAIELSNMYGLPLIIIKK